MHTAMMIVAIALLPLLVGMVIGAAIADFEWRRHARRGGPMDSAGRSFHVIEEPSLRRRTLPPIDEDVAALWGQGYD